jgi:hypothetical protein
MRRCSRRGILGTMTRCVKGEGEKLREGYVHANARGCVGFWSGVGIGWFNWMGIWMEWCSAGCIVFDRSIDWLIDQSTRSCPFRLPLSRIRTYQMANQRTHNTSQHNTTTQHNTTQGNGGGGRTVLYGAAALWGGKGRRAHVRVLRAPQFALRVLPHGAYNSVGRGCVVVQPAVFGNMPMHACV